MHLAFLNGFILATTFFQIATSDTVGKLFITSQCRPTHVIIIEWWSSYT